VPGRAAAAAPNPGPEPLTIDLERAHQCLAEFEDACSADNGALWGRSICGPIIFVDPVTRDAVANVQDGDKALRARAGLFVGRWPSELPLANTALDWQGTRWTMVMWTAIPNEDSARLALLLHEAFHRVQPDLGLDVPNTELSSHLDSAEGRISLQLEWNSLQAALQATGEEARRQAIADALTFRADRRRRFPSAATRENALEISEGLAEYTGLVLARCDATAVLRAVADRSARETGFVRSFAYASGPLYGLLLDSVSADWRGRVTKATDLGELLGALAKVKPATGRHVARAARRYGGIDLRARETARARERITRIAAWLKALVDEPVMVVDLGLVSSVSFDPRQVFAIDDARTVYTARTLIADWGRLVVDDGALLEDASTNRGTVSLVGAAEDGSRGAGWSLELADGWTVAEGERAGDRRVVRAKDR
jgi:hypothetical protein